MSATKPPQTSLAILGRVIRARRRELGLTQQQVADFSGCGLAYIHLLERGKPRVRLDKLAEVLSALGLRLRLENGPGGLLIEEGAKP